MTDIKDPPGHCAPLGSVPGAFGELEHEQDSAPWSRRQMLGAAGIAAGAFMVPRWLRQPAQAGVAPNSLTGGTPLRVAMHVHGSWSEAVASWHAQFQQASANALDVLYLTDHDFRAMALGYATSLSGVPWVISSTGTFAQKASTVNGGSIRLLAESSSATASATVTMRADELTFAKNKLRTSIAGITITQKITSAVLTNGARYEVVVPLSYHPATAGRPAGQYQLVYRFGGAPGRWKEGNGLTGVVRAPTPSAGSVQVLNPATDVAAIWPDLVTIDNCFYGLSFVARSPKRTAVADVRVASMTFTRTQNSAASVIANQAAIVSAYRSRYPAVTAYRQTEISKHLPDLNTFGMPQWLPDYSTFSTVHDTLYKQLVDRVHALGGIVSYNHPFGYNMGPLLSAADQTAKRRQLFTSMNARHAFGADILEVGYAVRGQVDAATHIALWDTFSRNGTFLTGNGVNDDHSGQGWKTIKNGFFTGIWAASRSDTGLAAALRAGRAFTAHLGRYPRGELDMLVDGTVRMGKVSVSTKTSRQLAIYAANVPSGATVQLIAGPVDYAGQVDPGTTVARSFAAPAFANGVVTVSVNTSSNRFYRVQVRSSTGEIIGTGNPVWLLRQAPPSGIPGPRQ
ncbi:MAG: hypothetical protein ACM3ML_39120 [Micromonosporaceae bacterium]